jgi:hypothetical protein
MLKTRIVVLLAFLMGVGSLYGQDSKGVLVDYRLLATNKTSTMTKELNEAAAGGFRLEGAMGGESAYGGAEVVAIMSRNRNAEPKARYEYRRSSRKPGTWVLNIANRRCSTRRMVAATKSWSSSSGIGKPLSKSGNTSFSPQVRLQRCRENSRKKAAEDFSLSE